MSAPSRGGRGRGGSRALGASLARTSSRVRLALALGGLALAALLVLALRGHGDGPPPADAATRLVPADALVYVHLSTDGDRKGTRKALEKARAFPGYADARSKLVGRLSAPDCGVKLGDVKGKEAAFALLDAGAGTAGSLVLVDTGRDQSAAPVRTCGTVQVVGIGRFLAVGQPQSLTRAQALGKGGKGALAADPLYRRASAGLPAGRVLDGWVSATGVRRLLAPQAGVLGAAGTLLDQPGLRGSAFALTAADGGARVSVASELTGGGKPKAFTPQLDRDVPSNAVAYLGLPELSTASTRLLSASGAGGVTALAPLLQRARAELAKQSGGGLDRDLLSLLRGEVAVVITPAVPAPTLSLIARTRDAAATARTLQRLQVPLARILRATGKPVPAWRAIGGAFQLKPAPGVELDYAVVGDELVVSTRLAGVEAARKLPGRLADAGAYQAALGGKPTAPVSSVVFLDFSQLLRLGEQTGLNDSRSYLAAKADLQRIKAIGARSSSSGNQTTAELFLTIP